MTIDLALPCEGDKASLACFSSGEQDSFIHSHGVITKLGDQFRYTCSSDYGFCTGGVYTKGSTLVGWHVAGGDKDNVFIPVTQNIIEALREPIKKKKPAPLKKTHWENNEKQPNTPKSGRKPERSNQPTFKKSLLYEGTDGEIQYFKISKAFLKQFEDNPLFRVFKYALQMPNESQFYFRSTYERDAYKNTHHDEFFDNRTQKARVVYVPESQASVTFANTELVRSILKKDNDDVKFQSQSHLNSLAPKADGPR